MNGYPAVLTGLSGRRCVIAGGGAVAARKAAALVEAGARPIVISPAFGAELVQMGADGQVELVERPYEPGDLAGAALAIAATDDRATNVAVSQEAQARGVPVNVVDDPELCTFIAPAVIRRGELLVAISTGGGSPALSRHLREMLESAIDPAYGELLAILAELRPRVLREVPPAGRRAVWDCLLDGELLSLLRARGPQAARERAGRIVDSLAGQG